ncbi:hypothetical protein [Polaromonas sp.]|uniref:hypothetical protein n=1 Tax=Polaromonas sp. TaxID=1869339 RepID=UPI00286B3CD9|nr:hypothetical protein [Polaromonas sp.]
MKRKMIGVLAAAVVGAGVGALLGYGPLLRYSTEGVLNMEMGTAEYKRFAELAKDASTVRQFVETSPPTALDADGVEQLVRVVTRGEWHKPVPKVSKADAKELPDILLQMEQDRDRDRERDKGDKVDTGDRGTRGDKADRKPAVFVYLGLRLTHTAHAAAEAASVATWMGGYFKDVATREAVRDQVLRWTAESRQFSDRALERKLKYEFDIEQAQTRAASLKKIVASYPETGRREAQQVVDVRKDNEKFMSPQAQLVGAESEIIEIRGKIQKLEREIEQQTFAKELMGDAEAAVNQARSGSESVIKLSAVIADFSKKVKTEAEREKLSSLAADVSQITARFLSQAQFVAKPSVPSRPERPSPLTATVLGGLLAALLAAIIAWRGLIIKLLWQDDRAKLT